MDHSHIFIRQPKISETALVAETIRTDFLFSKINSSILHLTHLRLNTFERIENHEFALDDELCTKKLPNDKDQREYRVAYLTSSPLLVFDLDAPLPVLLDPGAEGPGVLLVHVEHPGGGLLQRGEGVEEEVGHGEAAHLEALDVQLTQRRHRVHLGERMDSALAGQALCKMSSVK